MPAARSMGIAACTINPTGIPCFAHRSGRPGSGTGEGSSSIHYTTRRLVSWILCTSRRSSGACWMREITPFERL